MAAATPFFQSTHTDHSGWLVAVTITFLIYSIFGVGATITNRLRMGVLKFPDWFIVAALLFHFAQAIVLIRAAVHGLGNHQLILSDSTVDSFHKEFFASDFLSIIVYTTAKLFVILFFMSINSRRELNRAGFVVLGIIVAWGISSILLLSFRCGTSHPWLANTDKCLSVFGIYLGIDIGNIITDIILVILPTIMMWTLQIGIGLKAQVISLFATRLLVPVVLIVQIAYLDRIKSNDFTWTVVEPAIIGEVALSLSILTSCVPSLKNGIEAFFSGASQFVVPTEYTSSQNQSGSYGLGSKVPNKLRGLGKSAGRSQQSKNQSRIDDTQKSSFLRSRERGDAPDTGLERSESQTNLRDNHIMRTTEVEVAYETSEHTSSARGNESEEGSYNSNNGYHAKVY